jgi:ATP-dependent DNA helicase RecQ
MLVSEPTGLLDNSDRQRVDFFLQQQQKLQQQALSILPKLPRKGSFAEVTKLHADAAIALGLLHRAGNLVWHDPFEYEILDHNLSSKASRKPLENFNGDQRAIAQMQAYIRVTGDRWAFLLNAFGFEH